MSIESMLKETKAIGSVIEFSMERHNTKRKGELIPGECYTEQLKWPHLEASVAAENMIKCPIITRFVRTPHFLFCFDF